MHNKNLIVPFLFVTSLVVAQPLLVSNVDIVNTPNDLVIPQNKVVYFNGQKYCYLYDHMNGGFYGKSYCWKGDVSNLTNIMSDEAKKYLDSISFKYKIDLKNVNCIKLNEDNVNEFISQSYLKTRKYTYFNFERTYDCFEKKYSQNFRGKIRINKNTKLYMTYFKSIPFKKYEQLSFYVIN